MIDRGYRAARSDTGDERIEGRLLSSEGETSCVA
jgi:hypothetical protein